MGPLPVSFSNKLSKGILQSFNNFSSFNINKGWFKIFVFQIFWALVLYFEEVSDQGKRDNFSPYVQTVGTKNKLLQKVLEDADLRAQVKKVG